MEIMNNDYRSIEILASAMRAWALNSIRKSLILLKDGRLKAGIGYLEIRFSASFCMIKGIYVSA
jgi:hypothetical protein